HDWLHLELLLLIIIIFLFFLLIALRSCATCSSCDCWGLLRGQNDCCSHLLHGLLLLQWSRSRLRDTDLLARRSHCVSVLIFRTALLLLSTTKVRWRDEGIQVGLFSGNRPRCCLQPPLLSLLFIIRVVSFRLGNAGVALVVEQVIGHPLETESGVRPQILAADGGEENLQRLIGCRRVDLSAGWRSRVTVCHVFLRFSCNL
ncbi:hypothetical protein PMAYCL1PPCAC_25267, partial [Pristionchus mayeri]